jgi:hypothetical protein
MTDRRSSGVRVCASCGAENPSDYTFCYCCRLEPSGASELDDRAVVRSSGFAELEPLVVDDSLLAGSGSAKYSGPGVTDWLDRGKPDHEKR